MRKTNRFIAVSSMYIAWRVYVMTASKACLKANLLKENTTFKFTYKKCHNNVANTPKGIDQA